MNGYRIAQVSEDVLKVSQGAIYPALIRLEEEGWIRARGTILGMALGVSGLLGDI